MKRYPLARRLFAVAATAILIGVTTIVVWEAPSTTAIAKKAANGNGGGGGGGVTNLCVSFGSPAANGLANFLQAEYCHQGGSGILAQINGKGQFTFASGQTTKVQVNLPAGYLDANGDCCIALEVPPLAGPYRIRPMISFGDGFTSPIDLTSLPVDEHVSTNIALEISLDNPNADVDNVVGWTIVFRHPPNGADLQCERGVLARVTRTSSDSWTITTPASPTACLYETVRTGKGKHTETKLQGRINFPIRILLEKAS